MNKDEIDKFLDKIPEDMDLEINISCPNTEHNLVDDNIHKFLNNKREWCSVKLSPLCDITLIDKYYNQGFRKFHCSNTLAVEKGGLSGPSLKPFTTSLIQKIKKKYPDTEIIAGGGIRDMNDIVYYKKLGATHYSISTLCFNPFMFGKLYFEYLLYN